ncbi:hypothetical protein BDW67DRAFT_38323 [Aspergillus spinulosporus]
MTKLRTLFCVNNSAFLTLFIQFSSVAFRTDHQKIPNYLHLRSRVCYLVCSESVRRKLGLRWVNSDIQALINAVLLAESEDEDRDQTELICPRRGCIVIVLDDEMVAMV